jgi:L,D-peptidoglycan transpeptidase YkuD (ErfK/YbiS/YcfS/YnhG family)
MLQVFAGIGTFLAIAVGWAAAVQADDACPTTLAQATRLALVVTPSMQSVAATLRRFERSTPGAAWHEVGRAEPTVVGKGGLGWGWTFANDAKPGEPAKHEGDMRAPAGFYPLGRSFGLMPAGFAGYLWLVPEKSFCVDDARSADYGAIVPHAPAGKAVSGEKMCTVPLYRRGLTIDYPLNRAEKAGSCVFVHVWRSPRSGTAGCVALAEDNVKALQEWAKPGTAVIGILPTTAFQRFAACLPGVPPPP